MPHRACRTQRTSRTTARGRTSARRSAQELGQRDDALTANQEAVESYRVLAQAGPYMFRPDLAMSLNTSTADNPVQGSDQQGCGPSRLTVMITGHVPAVRLPPDHAGRRMAAAVPAPGGVADHRDLDPAPSARRAAAAPAVPPETELGGPGTARDPARRDPESAAPGAAAAGHPGHHAPLAPRHRPPPLGRQVHPRQDRPAGDPQEHQDPGPPAGPGEPRMGIPQDPRGTGRPRNDDSRLNGLGNSQEGRNRPCAAPIRAYLAAVPAFPGRGDPGVRLLHR